MSTEIQSEIRILLDGQQFASIPAELTDLAIAIDKSQYILKLEPDFDGEGGAPYSKETWLKAVHFITDYAKWLFDVFNKRIETPKIYHGPEGSIDLLWENKRFNLLINIPASAEMATFYGDDFGSQITQGKFDPANFRQALLPDLSILS